MKENKFLFYGCITAIIVCAAWTHFRAPRDIEFVYEPKTAGDVVSNSSEKTQHEVSYKCATPTKIHHIIYEGGNIIAKEYDTYNAQCMCMISAGVQKPIWIDLENVDSKMFESETAEDTTTKCNNDCQKVCEQSAQKFFENNPNFNLPNPFSKGKFQGCGAKWESKSWAQETNGQSTERYYSTNTITCKCLSDDETQTIEKTEMYQYFSEPDKRDLDCNKKCTEICAE